jgi:hypothetical protein
MQRRPLRTETDSVVIPMRCSPEDSVFPTTLVPKKRPFVPPETTTPPIGWMAYYRFEVSDDTHLHPTMVAAAEEVLRDRVPVIGFKQDCLSMMCAIKVDHPEEAGRIADEIAGQLLGRLGLTSDNLYGPVLEPYRPLDEYFAPEAEIIPIRALD